MKTNTFFAARGWAECQILHVSLDYCISMNDILRSEAAWMGALGR